MGSSRCLAVYSFCVYESIRVSPSIFQAFEVHEITLLSVHSPLIFVKRRLRSPCCLCVCAFPITFALLALHVVSKKICCLYIQKVSMLLNKLPFRLKN
jgi:hypothetical protein